MAKKGKKKPLWMPRGDEHVDYEPWQLQMLARIEKDTRQHLSVKPRRMAHSISVARTAERMALLYHVDPYLARVAGYLHDWDKVVPSDELIRRAHHFGVDLGVPLETVEPLLHGIVAARELPDVYPHFPHEVWHAIACHTTAAADMSPLDMVLFVADGIEPLRKPSTGIEATRALVGKVPLEDVFWNSFVGGLIYVLEGGRYLYPGALDIYNSLARDRARKRR